MKTAKIYTVGGELRLEQVRLAGETEVNAFSGMDDDDILEAVELVLRAVDITLEPMIYLKADDISDQSAPFIVHLPDGEEIDFATHDAAYEYLEDLRMEDCDIVNRWGNSVETPDCEDDDE